MTFKTGRIYRNRNQAEVDMAVIRLVANYGLVGLALLVRWIRRDDPSVVFAVDNVTVNPRDFDDWKDVTDLYEKVLAFASDFDDEPPPPRAA